MTVKQLMEKLAAADPDATVHILDDEADPWGVASAEVWTEDEIEYADAGENIDSGDFVIVLGETVDSVS